MPFPWLGNPSSGSESLVGHFSLLLQFFQPTFQHPCTHQWKLQSFGFEIVEGHTMLFLEKHCESIGRLPEVALPEFVQVIAANRLFKQEDLSGSVFFSAELSLPAGFLLLFFSRPFGVVPKDPETLDVTRGVNEMELRAIGQGIQNYGGSNKGELSRFANPLGIGSHDFILTIESGKISPMISIFC